MGPRQRNPIIGVGAHCLQFLCLGYEWMAVIHPTSHCAFFAFLLYTSVVLLPSLLITTACVRTFITHVITLSLSNPRCGPVKLFVYPAPTASHNTKIKSDDHRRTRRSGRGNLAASGCGFRSSPPSRAGSPIGLEI